MANDNQYLIQILTRTFVLLCSLLDPSLALGEERAESGVQKVARPNILFEETSPGLLGRTQTSAITSDGTPRRLTAPARIQTIKGGDVTMKLGGGGKPLSFTRGNGGNLINTADPSPELYLTTLSGSEEKTIPIIFVESKNGKLIAIAADGTRVTFAVNAGQAHISFGQNARFFGRIPVVSQLLD